MTGVDTDTDTVNIRRALAKRMAADLKKLGLDNMSEVLYHISEDDDSYSEEEYFDIISQRNLYSTKNAELTSMNAELLATINTLRRQLDIYHDK